MVGDLPIQGPEVLLFFLATPFAWLLTVAFLLDASSGARRFFLAGLFFSVGYWSLTGALYASDWMVLYPWLHRTEIPFVWLTGPCAYVYFRYRFDQGFRWTVRRHLVYFLPGLSAFLVYIPLAMVEDRQAFLASAADRSVYDWSRVLIGAGEFQNIAYLVVAVRRWLFPSGRRLRRRHRLLFLLFIVFVLGATLFDFSQWSGGSPLSMRQNMGFITLATGVVLAVIFIVTVAWPSFLNDLVIRIEESRYRHSRLSGVDIEAIRSRLLHAMETESLYLRSELTLNLMARHVGLSGPGLSQFINQEFNRNFNTFVNEYRIAEACRLLKGDPELPIIHVCYSVGFNSPSAFHSAFKSVNGLAPAAYRKQFTR